MPKISFSIGDNIIYSDFIEDYINDGEPKINPVSSNNNVVILNQDSKLPFGKYKGSTVDTVMTDYSDYNYLLWWRDNVTNYRFNAKILDNIAIYNLEK